MSEDFEVKVAHLEGQVSQLTNIVERHDKKIGEGMSKVDRLDVTVSKTEEALFRHSESHTRNYNDLKGSVDDLKSEFSQKFDIVFRNLNTMLGRDSVLKMIFGALVGAAVVYLFTKAMGG